MLEEVALSTGFGEEAGRFFQEVLESKGVEFVGGDVAGRVRGRRAGRARRDGGGEGDRLRLLRGGRRGAAGRDAGAEGRDRGRRRDRLRLAAAVLRRGDLRGGRLCSYDSVVHGRRLRVEHWDVALQQGRYAGAAMLGEEEPFKAIPYFFSDLADWAGLEYVGPAKDWDEVVFRGRARFGRVLGVVPEGRAGRRRTIGRALRGPRARPDADRNGGRHGGAAGRLADLDSDLESVGRVSFTPDAIVCGCQCRGGVIGKTRSFWTANSGFESLPRQFESRRLFRPAGDANMRSWTRSARSGFGQCSKRCASVCPPAKLA